MKSHTNILQNLVRMFSKKQNKGYSLVELMIVVAIIGLLAAIGVPQYSKFQARARQSEAKAALSALYTAEKSFQAEWQHYSVDLKNIGFGVEGQRLRYTTGFDDGTTVCSASYNTNVVPLGAPAEAGVANIQSHLTAVNTAGATWEPRLSVAPGTAIDIPAAATCSDVAFTAASRGDPNNNPGTLAAGVDVWTINHQKLIRNTTPGIN